MSDNDAEFFVGWQGKAPPHTGRRLAWLTAGLALAAIAIVAALAAWQRTIGPARWDYGHARTFAGLLLAQPAPTLLLDEPEPESGAKQLLLVQPGKFGFDPDRARALDGTMVRLRATVLTRDGRAMLEVEPRSVAAIDPVPPRPIVPGELDLGEHVLQGEIVDSKCFLGAMNPGVLKPHRACAIRCIGGGVPPVLLVRDAAGSPVYYLLAGPAGEPINDAVLDFVAEPVEIRGQVRRRGEQLVLRAAPETIRRLP